MEVQENWENVFENIINFANINDDHQKYTEHCDHLKKIFFDELCKYPEFSNLFNGFQLKDSYGDNVYIPKPAKFGFVFRIKFPEHTLINVEKDPNLPGNVLLNFTKVIEKKANKKCIKNFLDDNNYLIVERLHRFLVNHFRKALQKLSYHTTFNEKISVLRYARHSYAHRLYVMESNDFKYSIDFVPGILLEEQQSIVAIKGQWVAIPHTKHKKVSYRTCKVLYCQQEQEIIENKKQLKNALQIMNKFRDNHLGSWMRSYYIKTICLNKAKKESASYWEEKPFQEILSDMFKEIDESLSTKNLPFYWDNNYNLYKNISHKIQPEMLRYIKNTQKRLEGPVVPLTSSSALRIYRIFLNLKERDILMNKGAKTKQDPSKTKSSTDSK